MLYLIFCNDKIYETYANTNSESDVYSNFINYPHNTIYNEIYSLFKGTTKTNNLKLKITDYIHPYYYDNNIKNNSGNMAILDKFIKCKAKMDEQSELSTDFFDNYAKKINNPFIGTYIHYGLSTYFFGFIEYT